MRSIPVIAALALVLSGDLMASERQFCVPMLGKVILTPEHDTCTVAQYFRDDFLEGEGFLGPGDCYTVEVNGLLDGRGYAGRTAERASDGDSETSTSIHLLGTGKNIHTARAKIFFPGGSIRSTDLILEAGDQAAELLTVLDGDGIYAGATGSAVVMSNAIGQWARFKGAVCLPY